jgi:hypothetical protein
MLLDIGFNRVPYFCFGSKPQKQPCAFHSLKAGYFHFQSIYNQILRLCTFTLSFKLIIKQGSILGLNLETKLRIKFCCFSPGISSSFLFHRPSFPLPMIVWPPTLYPCLIPFSYLFPRVITLFGSSSIDRKRFSFFTSCLATWLSSTYTAYRRRPTAGFFSSTNPRCQCDQCSRYVPKMKQNQWGQNRSRECFLSSIFAFLIYYRVPLF